MANKTAIIAAGTNDEANQSAQTQTNLTNTITKHQNEGYEVVVIPPNSATKAVQHEAAVNAATAKGATIFEGNYGKFDTSSLTSASAASIRNTFPNAFVVKVTLFKNVKNHQFLGRSLINFSKKYGVMCEKAPHRFYETDGYDNGAH